MPTSQTANDNAKPRLRGDMYRRAEERHRAETALSELTAILTPTDPGVYDAAPIRATAIPTPAGGTVAETAIVPLPVTTVIAASAVEPVESSKAPDARGEDGAAEHELADAVGEPAPAITTPAPKAAVSRHRERTRRALIPATALATIAIASAFGIAGIVWPSHDAETPALAQSTPAVGAAGSAAPGPAYTGVGTVRDAAEAAPRDTLPTGTAGNNGPQTSRPQTSRPGLAPQARQNDTPPLRRTEAVEQARQATGATAPVRAGEAQLRVTSTPSGARVTVNGIGWGQTPVTIGHLPFGTKTVRLTYDGYGAQQRVVDLNGGSAAANLHVALRRQ